MVATRSVSSGGARETTHSPSGPATHEPPSARTSALASATIFRHAEPVPISSRRINPEIDRTYSRGYFGFLPARLRRANLRPVHTELRERGASSFPSSSIRPHETHET